MHVYLANKKIARAAVSSIWCGIARTFQSLQMLSDKKLKWAGEEFDEIYVQVYHQMFIKFLFLKKYSFVSSIFRQSYAVSNLIHIPLFYFAPRNL